MYWATSRFPLVSIRPGSFLIIFYELHLLTCQSADILASLCGVCVRVRVIDFSKTTRPRDMLLILKDTLSIEDENLFKACRSVRSSVPQSHYK